MVGVGPGVEVGRGVGVRMIGRGVGWIVGVGR